jgi:hypothetical protein
MKVLLQTEERIVFWVLSSLPGITDAAHRVRTPNTQNFLVLKNNDHINLISKQINESNLPSV